EQEGRALYVATSLQHFDGEGFKHQCKTRMLASPRNRRGLYPARLALASWRTGPQEGLELHGIQMPPGSFGRVIGDGTHRITVRTPHGTSTMRQVNLHPLLLHRKRNLRHFPGSIQT